MGIGQYAGPQAGSNLGASKVRLGHIDYLNCLPVYHGILSGRVNLPFELVSGPPTAMNRAFLEGEVDVTPISSIEYARNSERCLILPELSVAADGRVGSILLFSSRPPWELGGGTVALTTTSATSVVLTKILLERFWKVKVRYVRAEPDLGSMLETADAALLIGDEAMAEAVALGWGRETRYLQGTGRGVMITDLGQAWKDFTGEIMVYALWAVRRELCERESFLVSVLHWAFLASRLYAVQHPAELLEAARRRRGLPEDVLRDYFTLIRHELTEPYLRGLRTFFAEAVATGELERVPEIRVWNSAAKD